MQLSLYDSATTRQNVGGITMDRSKTLTFAPICRKEDSELFLQSVKLNPNDRLETEN